ncbi:MAG: peptidoglycan editing factor PgeF [Halanaerobiales bacterium]|nr:peptidoglycan editing factor PgeF [Halanaerobiales bacterium]
MFEINEKNSIKYLKFNKAEQFGFEVIFTTRIGGYSLPPYDQLNLAYHTKDDQQIIKRNRDLIYNTLNYNPLKIIYGEQVHLNQIKIVNNTLIKNNEKGNETILKGIDGLISKKSDNILAGLFADCVPIFVFDIKTKVFALFHSGWKGTYQQILTKGLNYFTKRLNSSIEDIHVVIGPSISVNHYQVSKNLIKIFKDKFKYNDYYKVNSDRYYLDLKKLNFNLARSFKIKESNIYLTDYCTFRDDKLYYSYRRNNKTGRMAAFISQIGD